MFLIELLRYIVGYITFESGGGFSERFVNLCAARNIKIRSVSINENGLTAKINPGSYKKLREVAKRSGMKLKATEKKGLIFFIKEHRQRSGLMAGALFFALLIYFSSLFVWNIETVGGEKVSSRDILIACEKLGLKEGVLIKNIDTNELSRLLMVELSSKVSWLSVNIKATRAVVEVRDYEPWRKDTTYKEPCNIIADFDGLIMFSQVYNGVKAAKEGSGAKKGDLLISGIVENRDTSSQFMEARGKITAMHNDTLSVEINTKRKVRKYIGEKIRYKLRLLWITVPLSVPFKNEGTYETYFEEKNLIYKNVKLPFSLIKETVIFYTETEIKRTSADIFNEYTEKAVEKYKNTLVLESKYNFTDTDKSIKVSCDNKCIDFIGEKQKIYIE